MGTVKCWCRYHKQAFLRCYRRGRSRSHGNPRISDRWDHLQHVVTTLGSSELDWTQILRNSVAAPIRPHLIFRRDANAGMRLSTHFPHSSMGPSRHGLRSTLMQTWPPQTGLFHHRAHCLHFPWPDCLGSILYGRPGIPTNMVCNMLGTSS